MAGVIAFRVDISVKGAGNLAEMEARVKNPTPLFKAIIDFWTAHVEDKFSQSVGAESSGMQMDEGHDVFWAPLSEAYRKKKRRDGQPDQIMVATGDLVRALSSPDTIFQAISPEDAVFGTPLDPEDENKVHNNWRSRQAIFLGKLDREFIQKAVGDFLSRRGDFKSASGDGGLAAVRLRNEVAQMDIDLQNDIRDDAGVW